MIPAAARKRPVQSTAPRHRRFGPTAIQRSVPQAPPRGSRTAKQRLQSDRRSFRQAEQPSGIPNFHHRAPHLQNAMESAGQGRRASSRPRGTHEMSHTTAFKAGVAERLGKHRDRRSGCDRPPPQGSPHSRADSAGCRTRHRSGASPPPGCEAPATPIGARAAGSKSGTTAAARPPGSTGTDRDPQLPPLQPADHHRHTAGHPPKPPAPRGHRPPPRPSCGATADRRWVHRLGPHVGRDRHGAGVPRPPSARMDPAATEPCRRPRARSPMGAGPLSPPSGLRCSPLRRPQLTSADSPALAPTAS